ncbi:MAG TPA: outer membrane protein assembly factor BamA, partial [Sphingobacterium sp.]|nr:outer membrane protein assembly factor BamA [Sphingobacterium sp.]
MKHIYFLTTAFLLLISISGFSQIANRGPINLSDPNEINYLQPKDYVIGGVTVAGAQYLDTEVLLTISKLNVGQYIEVPGEATSNVIKDL